MSPLMPASITRITLDRALAYSGLSVKIRCLQPSPIGQVGRRANGLELTLTGGVEHRNSSDAYFAYRDGTASVKFRLIW